MIYGFLRILMTMCTYITSDLELHYPKVLTVIVLVVLYQYSVQVLHAIVVISVIERSATFHLEDLLEL